MWAGSATARRVTGGQARAAIAWAGHATGIAPRAGHAHASLAWAGVARSAVTALPPACRTLTVPAETRVYVVTC